MDARSLKVTATYTDDVGDQVTAELQAVPFYSPREFYVHVTTSTEPAKLNEYTVFHLKTDFHFETFNYVVSFIVIFMTLSDTNGFLAYAD